MTTSNISILHGGNSAPSSAQPPDGMAQLHLSGPVQVHVHLGQAPGPAVQSGSTSQRSSPVMLALLGLALAGGGYLAGTRHGAAPPPRADSASAAVDDLPPPPPLAPLAALPTAPASMAATASIQPAAPGDMPLALRQQLARPPVVTPPPGAAPAPARNPFGLGN